MSEPKRCPWPKDDALYLAYHDEEWGVPEFDGRALYEKLMLDGFQAGLSGSPSCASARIFVRLFKGFDPHKVARFGEKDVARLLSDAGIIRHRGKIEARSRARRLISRLQDNGGSFAEFLWGAVDGKPRINRWRDGDRCPRKTPESLALSKALKARGFRFCGPTIVYAFNGRRWHGQRPLHHCFRHAACAKLAKALPKRRD